MENWQTRFSNTKWSDRTVLFWNGCLPMLCSVCRFSQMWFGFQWWHADTSVQTYIVSAQQVPELFSGSFSHQWNYVKHVSCVPVFGLILCRFVCSKNMFFRSRCCPHCAVQNHKQWMSALCFISAVPCHQRPPRIKLVKGLCLLDNNKSRTGFSSYEVIVIDVQLALMGLRPWTGAPRRTRSVPPTLPPLAFEFDSM